MRATVAAVGEGVARVKPGDRVMGLFSQTWISGPPNRERQAGTLGGPLDGTLVEERLFDAEGLVLTPGYLTDVEARHAALHRGERRGMRWWCAAS